MNSNVFRRTVVRFCASRTPSVAGVAAAMPSSSSSSAMSHGTTQQIDAEAPRSGLKGGGGKTDAYIDWRSKNDRNRFFFAIFSCLVICVGVLWNEERERTRRHSSIQKDIEREKWRARQLGMEAKDDGFAEQFIVKIKETGEYVPNLEFVNKTSKM